MNKCNYNLVIFEFSIAFLWAFGRVSSNIKFSDKKNELIKLNSNKDLIIDNLKQLS